MKTFLPLLLLTLFSFAAFTAQKPVKLSKEDPVIAQKPIASPSKDPLLNYELIDESGTSFNLSRYQGSYLFLSFIFTRCPMPKMCPLTVQLNKHLFRKWKKSSNVPLKFLFVTLDPAFDTPKVLKEFGKNKKLSQKYFSLATAKSEKVLEEFASEFNAVGVPNTIGIMSHNMKSILIGPDGKEIKQYKDNEWSVDEVLSLLEKKPTQPVS